MNLKYRDRSCFVWGFLGAAGGGQPPVINRSKINYCLFCFLFGGVPPPASTKTPDLNSDLNFLKIELLCNHKKFINY